MTTLALASEKSSAARRPMPRPAPAMLIAMATGTGKTFFTVSQIYRLLESKLFRSILFLVDRKALAAQAVREFNSFQTPHGNKFNQEYEIFSQRFCREDFGDDSPFDPKVLPESYLTSPHTVLRLPRGTFTPYSQGVKANVIFFQKGAATENTWIFDARSNVPIITKKDRPLTEAHFAEFVAAYGTNPNGTSTRGEAERFKRFHISDIKNCDYKLDITWLKDESLEDADDLPEPDFLATEAITELEAVVDDLREIISLIEREETAAAAN